MPIDVYMFAFADAMAAYFQDFPSMPPRDIAGALYSTALILRAFFGTGCVDATPALRGLRLQRY